MKLCKRNTAITESQFNELFASLRSVHSTIKTRKTASAALYMYLMKMRTGFPFEDIGNIFGVSKSTVQRLTAKMRTVLKNDLVPNYINFVRSRDELIEHNTTMSNALYDPENQRKVMLVCRVGCGTL